MKTLVSLILLALAAVAMAQPSLVVSPQMLDSTVTLDIVALDEDGFVVVHAFDTTGELVLTPPLGVVYLPRGIYADVEVALDTDLLEANGYGTETKNVLPMIHVDANANEVYEFPDGGDVPVMVNDAMVVAELPLMASMMDGDTADEEMMDDMDSGTMMNGDTMMADGDMMTPMLMVSPQMSSTIMLDSVTLAEDGFVVVHAFDATGELVLTPPLGLVYLTAGTHEGVMVELDNALLAENGYGATAKDVLPMIHVDANANQTYEFPEGGDVPVMVNDEMVVATIALTLQ